jgi:hypothetical protein
MGSFIVQIDNGHPPVTRCLISTVPAHVYTYDDIVGTKLTPFNRRDSAWGSIGYPRTDAHCRGERQPVIKHLRHPSSCH